MKTNKVVAMVLVTVAALSSVACSDAPTEEVGVTGSAIENGHKCSEKELELRRKENVETTAGCFIFRCYDASKAGASNADPRWGNTGTRCPEPAPPPVEDAHDRRDERFACEKGAKQCTNKILMICAADRLSYVTAPDQSSEEARLCHQTPTSTPPASSTPPPAAQVCTSGQKQCVKRGSNGKYRMEQCTTDGTDWVTNQAYVPYETTDPTDCRKAAGLPY